MAAQSWGYSMLPQVVNVARKADGNTLVRHGSDAPGFGQKEVARLKAAFASYPRDESAPSVDTVRICSPCPMVWDFRAWSQFVIP